jgi:hypothetical protein
MRPLAMQREGDVLRKPTDILPLPLAPAAIRRAGLYSASLRQALIGSWPALSWGQVLYLVSKDCLLVCWWSRSADAAHHGYMAAR